MSIRTIGPLIGASFGLVYLVANSLALPGAVRWMVWGLAILAAVVNVVAAVQQGRRTPAPVTLGNAPRTNPFRTWTYWAIVAVEVGALLVGAHLLSNQFGMPHAGIAWVSLVVGTHFFALAALFRESFLQWLGAAITLSGVVGLVLAVLGSGAATISVVAGVVPGILLLGAAWLGLRYQPPVREQSPTNHPASVAVR